MDGMKFLRKHQRSRRVKSWYSPVMDGCFVKQGGDVPHQQTNLPSTLLLFGTAGIIPVNAIMTADKELNFTA